MGGCVPFPKVFMCYSKSHSKCLFYLFYGFNYGKYSTSTNISICLHCNDEVLNFHCSMFYVYEYMILIGPPGDS